MFEIFRKKHTTTQIGSALAQFSTPSWEQIEFCLKSLSIIDDNGDLLDENRYKRISNKLFLEILILKIFSIDFTCYSYYGNTEIKNEILDEMYLVTFKSLKETFLNQNLVPNIFLEEMKDKIVQYSNIIKDKKGELNIEGLGFQFSKNVLEEFDLLLSLAGTSVFASTSIPIKEFLKDIRIKQ